MVVREKGTVARGRSIHIGLNAVDAQNYEGWTGQLSGSVNDALALQGVADSMGFLSTLLINSDATSVRVIQEILATSYLLKAGDILLLTYSGHGGQVYDASGDEPERMDETWVLYDRELIDDELYALWTQFLPGVRIVVISDSCHSGTINT